LLTTKVRNYSNSELLTHKHIVNALWVLLVKQYLSQEKYDVFKTSNAEILSITVKGNK